MSCKNASDENCLKCKRQCRDLFELLEDQANGEPVQDELLTARFEARWLIPR